MIVAFRVDASTPIGSGHVMRCLALAAALRERGAEVVFICREHEGHLNERIRARGFPVSALPAPSTPSDPVLGLLGVTEHQDAQETLAHLVDPADWLIVDHYGLGGEWERRLRQAADRIMVLDDLADRDHDCDVLLDPTFPGDASRYAGLTDANAHLLLGPSFPLMDPTYAEARTLNTDDITTDPRLLVFFGGSDLPDLTSRALMAIAAAPLRAVPADVVVGSTNPHRVEIERLAAARPGTTVHGAQPHLANLMRSCIVAVGAGGVTAWERLCIGLPSVVVSLAGNQVESSRALASAGLISYVGTSEEVTDADLRRALEALLDDAESMVQAAELGQAVVDGLGALRVAEVVIGTPASDLTIRPAVPADRGLLFTWTNDPDVRRSSLTQREITWPEHKAWFDDRMARASCHLFVLEASGLAVGQVRFDIEGTSATLDYSVDRTFRGRGWGSLMVTMATKELLAARDVDVIANVRSENTASIAGLRNAGFRQLDQDPGATDVIALRLQRGDDRVTDDVDLIVGQPREDGK